MPYEYQARGAKHLEQKRRKDFQLQELQFFMISNKTLEYC